MESPRLCSTAVASWAEFEAAAPDFAARVRLLMTARKHLTMATLRLDGSPRISGTEVEFAGGRLRIGSMPRALKARDLLRDARIAIHGPSNDPPADNAGAWTGEAKVAGAAIEVDSKDASHRFEIDIREAVITGLDKSGRRLVIESWTPERGLKRLERD